MTNGYTYFLGMGDPRAEEVIKQQRKEHRSKNASSDEKIQSWSPRRLLATSGSDGILQVHDNVFSPRLLLNVAEGDSELQSKAFCCLYSESGRNKQVWTKALCVVDGTGDEEEGRQAIDRNVFRNVTIGKPCCGENEPYVSSERAIAYQGEYWVHLVYSSYSDPNNETMEIYKINPSTMKATSVVTDDAMVSLKLNRDPRGWLSVTLTGPCRYWLFIVGGVVVSACLLVGSFWMYHVLGSSRLEPRPLVLSISAVISLINVGVANKAAILFAAAVTISLLGELPPTKWLGRETLVWVLYASLVLSAWNFVYQATYGGLNLYFPLYAAIFGILLGHPVL